MPTTSKSDPVVAEYSRTAETYDEKWAFYVDATTRETMARLTLRPTDRLLDAGCGTGELLVRRSAKYPEARSLDWTPCPRCSARKAWRPLPRFDAILRRSPPGSRIPQKLASQPRSRRQLYESLGTTTSRLRPCDGFRAFLANDVSGRDHVTAKSPLVLVHATDDTPPT